MRKLFLIIMTLVACSWAAMAQTTYRGTVVDAENNEPLIGATIMPIGGGQGGATDIDGKFSITVPNNVKQAKVTYVGYREQVVNLTNNMTVKLTSTEQNLDDLVVVAYGTATKESLTGSVAVVGSKEIEERPVTSVTSALEGNAPGVQVNNSTGTPGSAPEIRIRGFNSINGSNSPLYVVDGVPFEGTIADLNPADIESMSVLKDAASCALYGNRGANGVILITTKRAKNVGKVDVTVQIRQGMYNRGLPFYDRLEANDWMQMMFNSVVNGEYRNNLLNAKVKRDKAYFVNLYGTRGNIIRSKMKLNIYGVPDNELFIVDPIDPAKATFFGGSVLPGYAGDLDWWDAISRNGYRQEYNVNASGATDKFNMFASAGYLKENGYVLGTDFERFNGRVNVNYQPVSYLRMGMNFALTQQNSEIGQDFANDPSSVANPFLTMFNAPIYPYYRHDADGNIVYDENGQPMWNTASYLEGTNIAWAMRLDKNDYNKTAIDANVYATAVIPYGFEFTVRGQMFRNKTNLTQYSNNIIGSQAGSGMLMKEFQEMKSHTFSQTLTWNHEYGNNHVDALLSHENFNSQIYYDYILKADQALDDNFLLNNFGSLMQDGSGGEQVRLESYLGRVRYNYDQKYFGEFSLRRDGSSRFAKDGRWGTFWSVGASWIISKEKFMEPTQNWLNYLKLRAAYGTVGNDVSAPYYSYMNLFGWSQYGTLGTLLPASLGNPILKWESTKTLDLGLEGSLFDDRFTFSIGYFNKQNSDQLFPYTLPASMGSSALTSGTSAGENPSVWRNVGTMQNTGWELQFGYDILRTADWRWNFNVDATFIKNKITKLPNNQNLPGQNLFIGESRYIIKTFTFAGVDQLTGQSMYYIDPMSPDFMYYDEAGNMKYDNEAYLSRVERARNDDNAVFIEDGGKYYTSNMNNASRKIQGSALPVVSGSFGTNVSWKGINLGLLFTYSLGGKTLDSNYQSLMSSTTMGALHKDVLKSWTTPTGTFTNADGVTLNAYDENGVLNAWVDQAIADGIYTPGRIDPNGTPEINSNYSGTNNASSSRFITSSNYLCLKNINVSYDFPRNWVAALKMQNLNLGFSCDNVFLVTRRKGMNPTYGFAGGQGANYVPARVFAFQLTAKF
ncbi:MAG: SusC/RagA family TonB-linked outer membrane protein [Muribaculaceae bacterium]|nr:SusC/RagA family TonB-linked outer membrane protein [Muribaculaceae bacterium]